MLKFLTNRASFLSFIEKIIPYVMVIAICSFFFGLYYALYESPADYQQGEYVRIMYVHVPSAWMALSLYMIMAIFSFCYLFSGNMLLNIIAREMAPIGTAFAFITLVTGSIWGKPTWGTWWVWDARLTFMLVLFFFYLGYLVLSKSLSENLQSKSPALLVVAGAVNVPIIKFSVEMWNSLHQPASVLRTGGPSIHPDMLLPLMLMFVFSISITAIIFYLRFKSFILSRKNLRVS